MTKSKLSNHPKRGSQITVDPIRKIKDIKSISDFLAANPRDYLLFIMGINNGLRIGDLLKLKVGQVKHLKIGDSLNIKESKTKKNNILVINKTEYKALRNYFDDINSNDDDFLFKSRKGNDALTVPAVNKMVKKWTSTINLRGNYGTHSLRKTWGYIQRTVYGVGFEIISKRFNHSSPTVTMRYLGIEDKEVHNTLMNDIN